MDLGGGMMGSDFSNTMTYGNGGESFGNMSGTGAAVAGGALGASSSSGRGNMERCPLNDNSFYCQLSKTTNIVSMVIYLLFIFVVALLFLYFLYDYISSFRKRSRY